MLVYPECTLLVGGFNPSEKYARQNGFIFPNFRGENKQIFELPPPSLKSLQVSFSKVAFLHLSLCLRGNSPPIFAGALTTEENSSLPHLNVIRIISLDSIHLLPRNSTAGTWKWWFPSSESPAKQGLRTSGSMLNFRGVQFTPTEMPKKPGPRKSIISQPSIFRCEEVMLVSRMKKMETSRVQKFDRLLRLRQL